MEVKIIYFFGIKWLLKGFKKKFKLVCLKGKICVLFVGMKINVVIM